MKTENRIKSNNQLLFKSCTSTSNFKLLISSLGVRSILTLLLVITLSIASCSTDDRGVDQFTSLKVQDMVQPCGVNQREVKFSWSADILNASSYKRSEVEVATDDDFNNVIFNSGLIANDKYYHKLHLESLKSNQKYFWRVRVEDNRCKLSSWSKSESFITGILDPKEWQAEMIGGDNVSMVRKEFVISKRVDCVIANVTSAGLYEFRMNGDKVGESVLDPVQTNTRKRLVYSSYDITELVRRGENAIGFYLGGGALSHLFKTDSRSVLLEISIKYSDGTQEKVITDRSWRGYRDGPITYCGLYEGEKYDARLELPGWDMHSFDDSRWINVTSEKPDLS